MKVLRVCKICNKEFYAESSKVKKGYGVFCGRKCMGKSYNKKIKRICKNCDKQFYVSPSVVENNEGIFCSRKCQGIYQSKYGVGEKSSHWKGGKIKRICIECNKQFYTFPSKIKYKKGRFCSKKCSYENMSKKFKGINSPMWSRVKINCLLCGKEFYVYRGWKKRNLRKFCSAKCSQEYYVGDKATAWKGGISFEPYSIKFNKKLKTEVRERDNYTCQICNKRNSKDVHHIDYDKINCNPNNLITLCRSCHSKTNYNRKIWQSKFSTTMLKRYGKKIC